MWAASGACVRASANHPFFLAMLDGTLAPAAFECYIRQDAKFLQDFALAMRRLAALAALDEDDVSLAEAAYLHKIADDANVEEQDLHASSLAALGVSDEALAVDEQAPTTLAITSFLLRCVADGRCEGLAALLPCFWVYNDVGVKMRELRATTYRDATRSPELDAWIDMYGGDPFGECAKAYRAIVERAAAGADDATRERMTFNFRRACDLTYMFWTAALDDGSTAACRSWAPTRRRRPTRSGRASLGTAATGRTARARPATRPVRRSSAPTFIQPAPLWSPGASKWPWRRRAGPS